LRGLARHFPELEFQIVTGVSAGAINAVYLAAMQGNLARRVQQLYDLWHTLECQHVFRTNYSALLPFRGAMTALLPRRFAKWPRGLFNAGPLAALLRRVLNTPYRGMPIAGIRHNLAHNGLKAVALIIGQLFNAIFLDVIDEDVVRMARLSEMIEKLDATQRNGFKPIDLLVLRPSQDLGKLATRYERDLPPSVKLFARAMGARETE